MLSGSRGSPDRWVARSSRVICRPSCEGTTVPAGSRLATGSSSRTSRRTTASASRTPLNVFEIDPISNRVCSSSGARPGPAEPYATKRRRPSCRIPTIIPRANPLSTRVLSRARMTESEGIFCARARLPGVDAARATASESTLASARRDVGAHMIGEVRRSGRSNVPNRISWHLARHPEAAFPSDRNVMRALPLVSMLILAGSSLAAQRAPQAIWSDPPHDKQHPARMAVLHVPSGGVKINGIALVAPGAGVHPTFVFYHGLPGNEKNFDLLQAVRRAGWNAITINYRGSWGSSGDFRFDNTLADAAALLAFLRDPANARALGVDTTRIVIAGHSMGGWVTAMTAAREHGLTTAVLISAAAIAAEGGATREPAIAMMAG